MDASLLITVLGNLMRNYLLFNGPGSAFTAMKEEGIYFPCGIASRMAVRTSKNQQQVIHYFEATWKAK